MYRFIALSAPSGAGKTTIAKLLVRRNKDMVISVSATTRPQRSGEKEGVDYYFLLDSFKHISRYPRLDLYSNLTRTSL